MTRPAAWRRRRLSLAWSLVVWTAIAALTWLDRGAPHVQRAEFYGWLIPFFISLGKELANVAVNVIYRGIEGSIRYIAGNLNWLLSQVKSFIKSSGAMFAKLWRTFQGLWSNALRPALVWLHDFYARVKGWFTSVFKPLFDWLLRVRDELKRLYKRFVQPILDVIDTTRRVLHILEALHVPFAQQLDNFLTRTEQVITENFQQILGELNHAIDFLNSVFTLDGLLQRVTFLGSAQRDAVYLARMWWNRQVVGLTAAEAAAKAAQKYQGADVTEPGRQLGEFLATGGGDYAGIIEELVPAWLQSAGLEPPQREA